ncbi:MAG TPA: SUMF1/EgtB/PvdO family nonheme iron enzyme [Rubrivivax sp.]|nr:SUMF1/EgtB/PvdO family nonheme iron enzyme [Rubrivivax sp.]
MRSATDWSASRHRSPKPLEDARAIRSAGPDLLSLALIDSRNHLLRLLSVDESPAALRLALHAGWYQEYWIARHVQRGRGEACDPRAPRLAGIEPLADAWVAAEAPLPTPEVLRAYLHETLEVTLELLAGLTTAAAQPDDAALCFYRLALLHEDRLGEALAEALLLGAPSAHVERGALWLPAQRWLMGSAQADGLVPHNERWAHEVAVPEFEIDAQPVNWAAFVEFADDQGYDRAELWTPAGWAWLQQQQGRRAPRHVEQLHGGVLVLRGAGQQRGLQRAPAGQPVLHVSRFEAEAWCRWAGRRLPTEPEWELAASTATSRGFVWGDVFEWVAGSARAWPGAGDAAPGSLDTIPPPGTQGVLRGASFSSRSRCVHATARRFAPPGRDTMFCGFRSCGS